MILAENVLKNSIQRAYFPISSSEVAAKVTNKNVPKVEATEMANNELQPLTGNRSREARPRMEDLATFAQQDFRIMSSYSAVLPFLPLLGMGVFIEVILSLTTIFEHI